MKEVNERIEDLTAEHATEAFQALLNGSFRASNDDGPRNLDNVIVFLNGIREEDGEESIEEAERICCADTFCYYEWKGHYVREELCFDENWVAYSKRVVIPLHKLKEELPRVKLDLEYQAFRIEGFLSELDSATATLS